jgi:hypothetical protein
VLNVLFPLGQKSPVFGGGGGGGGGGGDSDSDKKSSGRFTVTNPNTGEVSRHSTKAAAEAAAKASAEKSGTTVKDTTSSRAPTSSPRPSTRPSSPPTSGSSSSDRAAPAPLPVPSKPVKTTTPTPVASPRPVPGVQPRTAPAPLPVPSKPVKTTTSRPVAGGNPFDSGNRSGSSAPTKSQTLSRTVTSGGNPFDSGNRSRPSAPSKPVNVITPRPVTADQPRPRPDSVRPIAAPGVQPLPPVGGIANIGYNTNSPSADNFARPPGQDERVDRNRQGAAKYALQEAMAGGPPVPDYLQPYLPGGPAYDPARERDTFMGRTLGGVSDALGNVFSPNKPESLAPTRSPRPIMRGTPVEPPSFGQRFGDFLEGRRPLVGLGGVFNSEGSFADESGSGTSQMVNFSGGSDNDTPATPVTPIAPVEAPPADGRPPWWPPYLPWPPGPDSPYAPIQPVAPVQPMPVAAPVTFQPYSTSYSGLQSAISGAQNPLMMGIGGMIRRS